MSGLELLGYLTEIPFLIIFVFVAIQAMYRPRRANIDVAMFFGGIVAILVVGWVQEAFDLEYPRAVTVAVSALLMGMPYVMLRLVADFAGAPRLIMRLAELGLLLSAGSLAFVEEPYPVWYVEALIAYWVGLQTYVTVRFVHSARTARGVARRRLELIALGSLALAFTLFAAGVGAAVTSQGDFWGVVSSVSAATSALSFLFGFVPPRTLRHGWQAPEFRAFLARGEQLARITNLGQLAAEVERGVSNAIGSEHAALVLWNEEQQRLSAPSFPPDDTPQNGQTFPERVYASQAPSFTLNAPRDFPEFASELKAYGAKAMFGAPITTADRRYGVIVAYTPHSPLFAEEDLSLLVLLARQIALQLWSREAIDQAASLAAREEATRLKEDFLSAAAHDLKTPLTTLLGQTQLMERRIARNPERPPDREGFQRMAREALRMRALIDDLLDASRPDDVGFVTSREPTDMLALVQDVVRDRDSALHTLVIHGDGPVVADIDEPRMRQVVQNLVDNAVKYSPAGGEVTIRVAQADHAVELSVTDQGIGIDAADIPYVFQRFYRGAGVNDRKFGGMGLGLYLVERIVREHAGQVSVTSTPGLGSTFTVRVPIAEGEQ